MDKQMLSELTAAWQKDGVVILREFYGSHEIDAALSAYRAVWNEGTARITVDDMDTDRRMRLDAVPEAARRAHRFKLNDLYLEQASVRHLALNPRLVPVLQTLLGQPPALCNSLSLEYGTEQPDHVDSLYMTPRTPDDLVAAWVALEDCNPDGGLLRYWPGSHAIAPYVFSNGKRHVVDGEMTAWNAHMREQVTRLGLGPTLFHARKGDVFIWSAHLLHGGSRINAPGCTRRSIVFHYFSERDSRAMGSRLIPESGGYWIKRSHQPIPGSLQARMRQLIAPVRRRLSGR